MIAKSEHDIDALREGGRRLGTHLKELSKMVRPGVSAADLEKVAREMIARDGDEPAFLGYRSKGDREPYPSALCVSVNDTLVHSPAAVNGHVFEEGDIVCLDFGIRHKRLFTDHAVTVIVGDAKSRDDERLLAGTREALEAGIAAARVGNTTGHIGEAVERIAEKYGFGFPKNLSGHGVGAKVHEEPYVPNFGTAGEGAPLVEGLVIAIEPMMTLGSGDLYVDDDGHSYRTKDGSRTAHFEHTVLIGKSGPEVLTKV